VKCDWSANPASSATTDSDCPPFATAVRAPKSPAGHSELKALRLTDAERRQIEAFLRTLSAPVAVATGLHGLSRAR
jgi:hypothetical protein